MEGNNPATFLFCDPIFQRDDSSNLASWIGDHGPGQARDLASAEASFHRQQDDDAVASRLSGRFDEQEKVVDIGVGQDFRLLASHGQKLAK
jgi:hypothetical protein